VSAGALTRREFLARYYYGHRPVVITDAIDDWKARDWTPEALRALVGEERRVDVRVNPSGLLFDNVTGESRLEPMTFAALVDALPAPPSAPRMYFAQQSVADVIPDHARYIGRFRYLRRTDTIQATNLWFGDAGCVTPLHFDFVHNFFAQLYGRKEFIVFAPEDSRALYPNRAVQDFSFVSTLTALPPDPAEFPEFRHATPYRAVLEPSEVLFLPCGWWHRVHSLDVSISVNQWWVRMFSRNTRQLRLIARFLSTFVATRVTRMSGRPAPQRRQASAGRY